MVSRTDVILMKIFIVRLVMVDTVLTAETTRLDQNVNDVVITTIDAVSVIVVSLATVTSLVPAAFYIVTHCLHRQLP